MTYESADMAGIVGKGVLVESPTVSGMDEELDHLAHGVYRARAATQTDRGVAQLRVIGIDTLGTRSYPRVVGAPDWPLKVSVWGRDCQGADADAGLGLQVTALSVMGEYSMMRVGFIGVGHLGRHLAASLLRAGFPLTVHDRDRAAATDLLASGAAWAARPCDVAAAADTVITCLPSPAAVTSVVTGDAGILAGLSAGGTWIDMSTNDRAEVQRLAALAAAQSIACLEAPVTGGVHKAAAGTITVLVGGDYPIYEAHLPLLQALGGTVLYIGPLGSASTLKVITNLLAFIHLAAVGEALMLAKQSGLDLATTVAAITASSGASFVHETESPLILNGSYNVGFTLDLACKDLLLAQQLGRDCGVPLELGGLVKQIFQRARARYGGAAWSTMAVKLLEDALGTELRAAGFPESLVE